jgi:dienelactone hydrolase
MLRQLLMGGLLVFWASVSLAAQQPLDGQWEGALTREGSEAKITITFKETPGVLEGTMTMLSVGMFQQQLSKLTYASPKVHFEQENLAAIFEGEVRADEIIGSLQVIGLAGAFHLQRSKIQAAPYLQEEVRFRNGNVTLAGTLTTPSTPGAHAAIVFTHGGGPDTRDLSRFYADHFARHGVASLIYDKRGVGASAPELDWGRSSFDDLAGDALAGVQFLKSRAEIDRKRIGLYGPSNGGWVVELAAARSKDVAFIVVVSGGGIPSWESEVFRVEAQARANGLSENSVTSAVAFMQRKFDVARTGQGWEQFQTLIENSRKEPWFQSVNAPRSLESLRGAWIGQFSYNPYSDLTKLKVPILAIFGELDTETPAKKIASTTQSALTKGGNKRNTIKIFPGATHGIMVFPEERKPWYFFKFADGYVDLMTDWVLKQTES